MKIRVCSSLIHPKDVAFPSSTDNQVYSVTPGSFFNDPVCTCKGYNFTGHCKHIDSVEGMRCRWNSIDLEDRECPLCQGETEIFESEPEFE